MMIMQKKRKHWYIVNLCYKIIFFFKIETEKLYYHPLTYMGIIKIFNVVILKKKIFYKRSLTGFDSNFRIKIAHSGALVVSDEFKLYYMRERRKHFYSYLQNMPFLREWYYFSFIKIYNHYKFFYNSFFLKGCYGANYSLYRTAQLSEYIWKFYYPFQNQYNSFVVFLFNDMFEFENEFYNTINYNLFNLKKFDYPVEFFFFRKRFFKNDFYNFFFKNSSYLLTNNITSVDIFKSQDLDTKFSFTYKGPMINDIFLKNLDFNYKNIYISHNINTYLYNYYFILKLLFI